MIVARIARAESCRIARRRERAWIEMRGPDQPAYVRRKRRLRAPLASTVGLLPARKEECSLVFRATFWERGSIDISPGALEQPE
jgi:hypothetical protein